MRKVEYPKIKVCIAVPQHTVDALDRAAGSFDGMSRSFLCSTILTAWLEAQGFLTATSSRNSNGGDDLHPGLNMPGAGFNPSPKPGDGRQDRADHRRERVRL